MVVYLVELRLFLLLNRSATVSVNACYYLGTGSGINAGLAAIDSGFTTDCTGFFVSMTTSAR